MKILAGIVVKMKLSELYNTNIFSIATIVCFYYDIRDICYTLDVKWNNLPKNDIY
jgi:hypothetical protein